MSTDCDQKLLIVNADDLGRTPGINEGIFEAHRSGVVSSATLMVNYPHAAPAAQALASHPDLGVGLHVQLTGGPSALSAGEIPSLVDRRGELPRRPEHLERPRPAEVEAEVRAQLARFERLVGSAPTHLDSHHHSHRHPVVLEVVTRIAAEAGLPVRRADDRVARRLAERGIRTTDRFVDDFFGDATDLDTLLDILGRLEAGVTELMCHPAHPDAELRAHSTYVEQRATELATLCHPRARQALASHQIRLVHFGRL